MPIIPILLAAIGILIYFFGWIVLIWVFGLCALITIGTYIHDRIWPPKLPYPYDQDGGINSATQENSPMPFNGDKCVSCESTIFMIVPGKTSKQEISQFAKASQAWKENPDALAGYMHPGIYCPKGCFSILLESSPKESNKITH